MNSYTSSRGNQTLESLGEEKKSHEESPLKDAKWPNASREANESVGNANMSSMDAKFVKRVQ